MRIDGSILAAVSGGADSVAMLHMLLTTPQPAGGNPLVCAHYNHGLRDAADEDEAFVKKLCEEWEIPFVSEKGNVPKDTGVEAAAREKRYIFLERVRSGRGLDYIATAHTADDNIETVLLNLTRGAGLSGLCGIPKTRGSIIRPVLHLSRNKILMYLAERNIPYREDESNHDTTYRRNYIRHKVIPALTKANPALTDAVVRLTASLNEDEEYLMSLARAVYAYPFSAGRLTQLPRPIASRVCRMLVCEHSPYPPERIHIDAMLDIAAGGNGRRCNISSGLTVAKKNGMIVIERTENRRSQNAPGSG
jgi:tRNA(Ile)-lysidine synthase